MHAGLFAVQWFAGRRWIAQWMNKQKVLLKLALSSARLEVRFLSLSWVFFKQQGRSTKEILVNIPSCLVHNAPPKSSSWTSPRCSVGLHHFSSGFLLVQCLTCTGKEHWIFNEQFNVIGKKTEVKNTVFWYPLCIECYLLPFLCIRGACTELISEIVVTGIITQRWKRTSEGKDLILEFACLEGGSVLRGNHGTCCW